jgi:hypothetical protein
VRKTSRLPSHAFVVRPDPAAARSRTQTQRGSALASTLAFAFCGLAFGLRSGFWLLGAGFFGGGAALLAHITLYFRNASVFASETKFGMTTTLGRVRSRERSQLARVVLSRVSYGAGLGAGRPEMYFVGRTGKVLMLVKGSGWVPEQLAILWRHLGVVPEGSFTRATTLDEVSRIVPVAWARRNAGVVAVLVMFAFVFGLTAFLAHLGIHVNR